MFTNLHRFFSVLILSKRRLRSKFTVLMRVGASVVPFSPSQRYLGDRCELFLELVLVHIWSNSLEYSVSFCLLILSLV